MLNVQFNRTGPLLVLHKATDSLYQHFCVAFLVYVLSIPDSVRAGIYEDHTGQGSVRT